MKKANKWLIVVLVLVALCVSFIVFKAAERDSKRIEMQDVINLESKAHWLIQEYMDKREDNTEVLSYHVFIHNKQVFAFFDFKPLEGSFYMRKTPLDVVERSLFYGFAKFEKRFNTYKIVDFGENRHDPEIGPGWVTGSQAQKQYRRYFYGKILDDKVAIIEFYNYGILEGTYYVGDKDYYFIEINDNFGYRSHVLGTDCLRFYDKESRFLGDIDTTNYESTD